MEIKGENKKFNFKYNMEANKHLGNITNEIAKSLEPFTSGCHKHSSENITNFCSNMKCLLPLCPDCIEGHLEQHRQNKSTQEVESIKASRVKSIQKLQKLSQFISNEMISLQEPMQMDDIQQTTIERIKQIKQEVLIYLDKYFDQLQFDLIERIKNSESIVTKIDNLYNRMREKINSLANDCLLLKSNSPLIPMKIKEVMEIDSTQENLKFNKVMEEYNSNLQKIQMMINFDRKKFQTIFEETIKVQFKAKPEDIDQYVIMEDNIKYGRTPVLHYFESGSPYLHLIEFPRQNKKKFELKNNWKVPYYHTSVLMSNGDILLSGGIHNMKPVKYHTYLSKFDTFKYTFDLEFIKVSERFQQAMVEMNGFLFIMAGTKFGPDGTQVEEKKVEKVRFNDFKVIEMKPSLYGGPCRAIAKNGSIFKICKIGLEMFSFVKGDENQPRWTYLHLPDFVFNDQCAAVNVNNDHIFVFGGYETIKKVHPKPVVEKKEIQSEIEGQSQNEAPKSAVESYTEQRKASKSSVLIDISDINMVSLVDKGKYDLQIPGGFKNCIPVFYKKHLYALQNLEDLNGLDDDSERTILKFDGRKWQLLQ